MSNEAKSGSETAASGRREPASIDLARSEVRDLTAETEAKAEATASASASAETISTDPAKADETTREAPEPERPAEEKSVRTASEATPVAPPPPKTKSGRGGAMFLGALAGAATGVLGAFGMQSFLPPPKEVADPRIPALQTALGAAEKKIATPDPEIARLAAALKAAETKLAALEQKPPQSPPEVTKRIEALDAGIKGLEAGVRSLGEGVASVRAESEAAGRKLADIEKLASAPPPAKAGDAPAEAPRVDLAPVAARIVRIEEQIAEANAKAAEGAKTLSALEGRIKATDAEIAGLKGPRPGESASALLAIAGLARRALDQGEPVAGLVTAMGALGVPADDLKPLAAYGDRPVPKLAALAEQLAELAPKLPKPVAPEPPKDMSVADRLKANIVSLVEIKPTGAPKPVDTAGLVAKARGLTLSGDAAGALTALEGLNAAEKAVLKPFADAIGLRIAALKAVVAVETKALAAAARRN